METGGEVREEEGRRARVVLVRQLLDRALMHGLIDLELAAQAESMLFDPDAEKRSVVSVLVQLGVPEERVASLDVDALVGREVGGFRLESVLGVGGVGFVFRARQESLGRDVALKVLDPYLAALPHVRERFRREAQAAAKLDHPHVVQPIDYGEDAGLTYFAMEYLPGGSVADRLEQGPLEEAEALRIAREVADALVYASERRIVHRDVKPGNILFDRRGRVALADLGLALDLEGVTTRLTGQGMIMGSPHYIAPEQVTGEGEVDARVDIYALGITLYEMLSGQLPFVGTTPSAVLQKHIGAKLPPLPESVSRAARALVERMCAKKPSQRFSDARALAEAIERARTDPGALPFEGEAEAAPEPAAGQRRERRALVVILAALAVLVAAVVLGRRIWPKPPEPARTGSAEPARLDVEAPGEAEAAASIVRLLLAARANDGGYAHSREVPASPWGVAQGLAPLELAGADIEARRVLARFTHDLALRDAEGRLAGWGSRPEDTAALTEATAWAAFAIALAETGGDVEPPFPLVEMSAHLARIQTADGGLPTAPAIPRESVRTTATALGLIAMCALTAAGADGLEEPIARAAGWLGRAYDGAAGTWHANPHQEFGDPVLLEGLAETSAYALTEARIALEAVGRTLPEEALSALERFAARGPGPDRPLGTVGRAAADDYYFTFPEDLRVTLPGLRWVWFPWRLLGAQRIARTTGDERWVRAAARERARIAALPAELAAAGPFMLSECAFGVEVLRALPADDPRAGSLFYVVRERARR